ncbi:MAG: penicillin-binding transpeptidase domain-containing protein, partial [Actinomycetota bacterium]|nr:penicillin-binding transpeptidase domain-containing protein [Actinomycetota bacterium]
MASTDYRARARSFLPRDPRVAEPYRLTPRLAFRIGILGALALAAFALHVLRLWALQVLSGDEYLRVAQNNQLRRIRVEAPRGQILDRHGKLLVDNAKATSVQLWPAQLPKDARYRAVRRIARVLGVPLAEVLRKIESQKQDPVTPITLKENVPDEVVRFLLERQMDFPGVAVRDTGIRRYPLGDLASHVVGHVGEITKTQLKELEGYRLGDRIGQRGAEAAFDRFLRGRPGLQRLRIDSSGRPRGDPITVQDPVDGDTVRLTLDLELQRAAEDAIEYGIGLAHENDNWYADGGAAVALDPRNGEVLALASLPTYDPGAYVNPRKRGELAKLVNKSVAARHNYPGLNRAVENLYPPGSTFKPITALAAIQEGLIGPYDTLPCVPVLYYGRDRHPFRNWTPNVIQAMDLPTAIEHSCDTYFYELGYKFYKLPATRGHPFQEWAARWGFGRPTGLDIGGELPGL